MILDKEICKKCNNNRFPDNGWCKSDEQRWNDGAVACPVEGFNIRHFCNFQKAFDQCRYRLEHIVSQP